VENGDPRFAAGRGDLGAFGHLVLRIDDLPAGKAERGYNTATVDPIELFDLIASNEIELSLDQIADLPTIVRPAKRPSGKLSERRVLGALLAPVGGPSRNST
jgi:hypothetical protein